MFSNEEPMSIPVIDIFAGPGGLNEGFSELVDSSGSKVFTTVASIEMESSAVRTLRLRSVFRELSITGKYLPNYYQFIRGEISLEDFKSVDAVQKAFNNSEKHVHQIELGKTTRKTTNAIVRKALNANGVIDEFSNWVLIGGPPCQAYSLAGRSRRVNDVNFAKDHKHFLYEEYLNIIREFSPPVFVMENVKGMLSSSTTGEGIFQVIKNDLSLPKPGLEYEIYSLTNDQRPEQLSPSDFIVRSEEYGIPQKRHRVILLGVRKGLFKERPSILTRSGTFSTVMQAIGKLPALRSGISPSSVDNFDAWASIKVSELTVTEHHTVLGRGAAFIPTKEVGIDNQELHNWLVDSNIGGIVQHESRSHMVSDIERYLFAANWASEYGYSPKLSQFPSELLPKHKNVNSAAKPFQDRFRVQLWDSPSSTVVSHIAKDGHFFIHPDSNQKRSLTVREAARLQTFPDNYFFMGNRTQQYTQVGNAVPPLLANKIAKILMNFFEQNSKD